MLNFFCNKIVHYYNKESICYLLCKILFSKTESIRQQGNDEEEKDVKQSNSTQPLILKFLQKNFFIWQSKILFKKNQIILKLKFFQRCKRENV